MNEKILKTKSNGFAALFFIVLMIIVAIASFISSIAFLKNEALTVVGVLLSIFLFIGSVISFGGLKVVKPQEAIVLTLFGDYTGPIKEPGFYFVNPFSVAVNPASKTKLGQSGDVDRQNTSISINNSGIEANLDVIKTADYIIDMGPEGGSGGGLVIATGTPEEVAKDKNSHTGRYLKRALEAAVSHKKK